MHFAAAIALPSAYLDNSDVRAPAPQWRKPRRKSQFSHFDIRLVADEPA